MIAIPVYLASDFERPVGTAELDEDGNLNIKIIGAALVTEIEHLASAEHVIGLSLGVNYMPYQPKE